jgi:hypothetical protein
MRTIILENIFCIQTDLKQKFNKKEHSRSRLYCSSSMANLNLSTWIQQEEGMAGDAEVRVD